MPAGPDSLLFGTAGVPSTASGTSTIAGIREVARLGLDCLEVEFVKGVKMGGDTARKVRAEAEAAGVKLSVHAPYYINLNSPETGKRLASQERILHSARLARMCGAKNVVLHLGYFGKNDPEEAYAHIKKELKEVVSVLKAEKSPVILRPETMGKRSQFGSLEEILFMCREIEGILPCIDFCHIHAREGKMNSYGEFHRILRKIGRKLGDEALRDMHIHISGVMYNNKGEMKHLNLEDSDFRYDEWIQALRDFGLSGMVICESPEQAADALMLKGLYHT